MPWAARPARMSPALARKSDAITGAPVKAALPFTTASPAAGPRAHWVLVVRKPLNEVTAAVRAVRTAFLYAALAGVVLTLIFAIPLSVDRGSNARSAICKGGFGAFWRMNMI